MQKPSLENLQNDIDALLDHVETNQFSRDTLQSQIMHVLTETYRTLNKLDESRIENDHLGKFENDISSVQKYIDSYQSLLDKEKEKVDQDENLIFRHTYSKHIYESFSKDQEKALAELRIPIASNSLYEYDEHRKKYEIFMSLVDPKTLSFTQRSYANRDLFLNLYKRLDGYQITHEKIIKSAGLKIFTFFNVVTKVQKVKLTKYIGDIFSSSGATISLDSKRASSVKVIGDFSGFVLLDYMSNKKGKLYDFGFEEVFGELLKATVAVYKAQNNIPMIHRINQNRKHMEAALLANLLS